MTEEEDSILLSAYRNQVADFEREFDEIDCWFRKNNTGEVVVRTKAFKVVDAYKALLALDYAMMHTWHQLNYAVNHTREHMPIVEDEILSLKNKLQNTGCIAQVGKNNAAFIACTGDGTANGHLLANV